MAPWGCTRQYSVSLPTPPPPKVEFCPHPHLPRLLCCRREQKANQLEGQIKQQLDELDQKLNAEPEKRAEYYAIREKSARLQEMLLPMQRELDTLQRKHAAISAELSTDTTRKTALKLQVSVSDTAQWLREEMLTPTNRIATHRWGSNRTTEVFQAVIKDSPHNQEDKKE